MSPRTIHFRVLDKSPLLGPCRCPPFLNTLAGGFSATAPPGKFDMDRFLKSIVCYKVASFLCCGSVWLISLTRDQTCTPCTGKQSLHHRITTEVPVLYFPPLETLNLLWTRNAAFHLARGSHLCSHKPWPFPVSEAAEPVLLPLIANSRLSTLQATPCFLLSAKVFASCFIRCEPP